MEASDAEAVLRIYQEGVDTGQATFQTSAPLWDDWDKSHLQALRFVATVNDQVAGWVALSPVSSRCVYAGVAEVSIYIGNNFRGQKIGFSLMQQVIEASEQAGYWTLQAGIFRENTASIALHHKCRFRTIGFREKVGEMNGVWRDTVLLERRSTIVGVK
ncbi:MAG: phosphinothricin acetyltransferase [Daejeonella sp.]|nr:phosphinothricin acetyltransferase [Daejeonella sp.]